MGYDWDEQPSKPWLKARRDLKPLRPRLAKIAPRDRDQVLRTHHWFVVVRTPNGPLCGKNVFVESQKLWKRSTLFIHDAHYISGEGRWAISHYRTRVATSRLTLRWMHGSSRTGCAWRTTPHYVARTINNRVIAAHDLYWCLLPQCEALHTCRSGFPFATLEIPYGFQQSQIVLLALHQDGTKQGRGLSLAPAPIHF